MSITQIGAALATINVPGVVVIKDATTALEASIGAFHNADEQSLPSTGGALLTAGVAQIIDSLSLANRQRQTGSDNITALGVASGTQQLATPITAVTGNTTVTAGQGTLAAPKAVTLSAITGTNRGVTWNIGVGSVFVCEVGTVRQEFAVVISLGAGTVVNLVVGNILTGAAFTHTANWALTTYAYNQARDASSPDGATGAGFAAGATYLLNSTLNTGAGGWEGERSAAGELDGASGAGTAIAAEYEWNAGGPLTNAGLASALQFDRARSLQGKGAGSATQNAGGAAGATSITVSSAAAVNSLQAGQQIRIDRNTGNEEAAYVSSTYVPGTAAITLQSALQFTHTAAAVEWDIFAANGPGLNGFTPAGVGIEEEALYNPVDGKYYIERAATQDAMPGANIVAESPGLWNGATFDRARGVSGDAVAATGLAAGVPMIWNGATYDRLTGLVQSADGISAPGAGGQLKTPILGANLFATDGSGTISRLRILPPADSEVAYNGLKTSSQNQIFNGTTWDRMRAGSGVGGTGAVKTDAGVGTWSAPANIASSVTAGTLQAANANRRALVVSNDSTAKLYILFGAGTVSATNYTYVVGAGATFETAPNPVPTTICTGVWASANGSAGITEIS